VVWSSPSLGRPLSVSQEQVGEEKRRWGEWIEQAMFNDAPTELLIVSTNSDACFPFQLNAMRA
jgi:hypothetical protein